MLRLQTKLRAQWTLAERELYDQSACTQQTCGSFRQAQAAGLEGALIPMPIPVEELLQRVKEALAQPA